MSAASNHSGTLSINASTIAFNRAAALFSQPPSAAGGVYNDAGTVNVATSIIAANSAAGSLDVAGAFGSHSYNLIGIVDGSTGFTNGVAHDQVGSLSAPLDPRLDVLRARGGPTETLAPLCDSPAIDAGDDAVTGPPLNFATDQRGRPRRAGSHVDIGAYEVQPENPPTISILDASVIEGDSGFRFLQFTVFLSAPTADGVAFHYATADGSAVAGSDYDAVSGTGFIYATSTTVTVITRGDTTQEADETLTVTLSNICNAVGGHTQAVGTIRDDDTPRTIQFSAASYQANEADGSALLTVTRTGSLFTPLTFAYSTVDEAAAVPCSDTTTTPGVASARCDYAPTNRTLTFAAGQAQQTIAVPIIDDAYREQAETFKVVLGAPPDGVTLGQLNQATVTINDNDTSTGASPLADSSFFVRQHYLDFLSRAPEQAGFDAWLGVLNRCPNQFNFDPASPSAACDRIAVSASFFGSPEFRQKGYFIYLFYRVAFDRRPHYAEFVQDMSRLTGETEVDAGAKRLEYLSTWAERPEFRARYDTLDNAAYIDALLGRYGVTTIHIDPQTPGIVQEYPRAVLLLLLNTGLRGRVDILRIITDSREANAAEFNGAFVTMQYFGYLRRDPEPAGYAAWLTYLNAHPTDYRTMVNGFMNSQEYRLRFGNQ